MDDLSIKCPKCEAEVGEKCREYLEKIHLFQRGIPFDRNWLVMNEVHPERHSAAMSAA